MSDLVWSKDGAIWPHREASVFVEAAGIRWHVQQMDCDQADAPSLLLIHGTGAATHSWRDLLPMLAQHFRVTALDLPGHGFTQAPPPHRLSLPGMAADIYQLLRKLDITPEIVVGHSAGAAILVRMCLDHKIAPRLLVSLNGALLPFDGIAGHLFSPLAKLLTLHPLIARLFARQASSEGAVERLLANTGSIIDAAGVAQYRVLVRNPAHVGAALRMMANWQLEPLRRGLPLLKTKLVLVAASNDRSVSPEVARRVAAMVPVRWSSELPGLGILLMKNGRESWQISS